MEEEQVAQMEPESKQAKPEQVEEAKIEE